MAEKNDLQYLGGDLGLPQRRFLLEPSSGLLDVVLASGITLVWLKRSNHAINDIINDIPVYFAHSICAS